MSVFIRGAGRDEILIEEGGDGAFVKISSERDGYRSITLPPDERQSAAQALAGDGYRVLPRDVRHSCVFTEDVDEPCPVCGVKVPEWERELLAREAQAAQPDPLDPLRRKLHADDRDEFPRVQGTCPSCGVGPLFLGEGGYVTCSWVDCKEPEAADETLQIGLTVAQPDSPEPVDPASVRVGDVVEIEANDGSWMVRARVADTDDPSHDGPPYPDDSPFGIKLDRFYWWPKIDGDAVRVLDPAEPEPGEAAVEALADALVGVGVTSAGPDALAYARALIRHRNVQVVRPMNEGYMDAAAVPVPDAGDDTLREQLAETLYEGWRQRNPGDLTWETESEWRRDEFRSWLDPLLPRIRDHAAAAVQAERERVAQNLEARAPSPGDAYHQGEFASGVRSGLVNAADIVRSGSSDA